MVTLVVSACAPSASTRLGAEQGSTSNHDEDGRQVDPPPEEPGEQAEPRLIQIAAGAQHTCALSSDGTVRCWGVNALGQLGFESDETCARVHPVKGGTATVYERCARAPTRVPGVATAVQIAAGGDVTCALLVDGKVLCWGDGFLGALGDGEKQPRAQPKPVIGLAGVSVIAVGRSHSCALLADGTLRCWGWGGWGQLGFDAPDVCNGSECAPLADRVRDLTGVAQVAVGGAHTCAMLSADVVKCWGENDAGQLGFPSKERKFGLYPFTRTPTTVPDLADVAQLTVASRYTCAAHLDGTVSCWGNNGEGQLGFPFADCRDDSPMCVMTPSRVPGVDDAVQIAAAGTHTCVRRRDGTVACWGRNTDGELGFPSDSACVGGVIGCGTPHLVRDIHDATDLAVGDRHTCTLLADGAVRCWGSNCFGQLGEGTATVCGAP